MRIVVCNGSSWVDGCPTFQPDDENEDDFRKLLFRFCDFSQIMMDEVQKLSGCKGPNFCNSVLR
jgi:hypothetical protein